MEMKKKNKGDAKIRIGNNHIYFFY